MESFRGYSVKESKNVQAVLGYVSQKDLKAGDKLPTERELSAQLGISRNSLREALKSLETIGVVSIRHGSGVYLLKSGLEPTGDATLWLAIHKTEILKMITVREALDLCAIDLIPLCRYGELRQLLLEAVEQMRLEKVPGEAMLEHDLVFHNIIRQAAENDVLLNICVALTGGIYDERKVLFTQSERVEQSLREHERIAEAFGSNDMEQVKKAYREHLVSTRATIEQNE